MPIDPKETTKKSEAPIAPPFGDEDPESEGVQRGLDVAEDELRSAVADLYEAEALRSDVVEESLDDIDYEEGQPERSRPAHEPGNPVISEI